MGAYYTPRIVADILTKWAIRSTEEVIMEPGFGGCGFLEAAQSRFVTLGLTSPFSNIYGCDKDHKAFTILEHKIGKSNYDEHFLLDDFLCLHPKDFSVLGFDVVIGNPPYISLHAMSQEQRATASDGVSLGYLKLDRRASLWAYFVLHAFTFLRQGGRCAWVLPSSYLHAEYARNLRLQLTKKFARLIEINLEQRLFSGEGAKERTIVLLADGFESQVDEATVQRFHAADVNALEEIVSILGKGEQSDTLRGSFLSPLEEATAILEVVQRNQTCQKLGEFLNIKIGIVTGANDFFIRNEINWVKDHIGGSSIRPILSKFSQVFGLALTENDLQENRKNGLKCLLLNISKNKPIPKDVLQYLAGFPPDKMAKNATFKKRSYWYFPDDGIVPDGFLSYMCDHGPRLALNLAKTTSTNTIHRVYFQDGIDEIRRKAIVISLLSTVTQFSAELVGRSYGSGVLKLEPSEARRVDIMLPDVLDAKRVTDAFNTVDTLLRKGNGQEARRLADALFVTPLFSNIEIATMDASLTRLRSIRRKPRRGN